MQMFAPRQAIKRCIFSIQMTETDGRGAERKASICLLETLFLLGYNEAFSGRSTKRDRFFHLPQCEELREVPRGTHHGS